MKIINKVLIILAISVTISACNTTKDKVNEDFTVNIKSPQVTIGEVEMQFEPLFGIGKLKKQNVTVLYFPQENAICLVYKFNYFTFYQFWNNKGRLSFINALQKYNEDYEAHNLQNNSKKTQKKYGIVRGYLVWQQFSFTVQADGNMNIELGHTFKDTSPYFSVNQRSTVYIDKNTKDRNKSSPEVTMYFTRAQAAELAAIFDQYLILSEDLEVKTPAKKKPFSDVLDAFKSPKKEDAPKDEY